MSKVGKWESGKLRRNQSVSSEKLLYGSMENRKTILRRVVFIVHKLF